MDPETLRMMTDPEAMKDPARVREWVAKQHAAARRNVLGTLRLNSTLMTAVGAVALMVGVGLPALSALSVISDTTPFVYILLLAFGFFSDSWEDGSRPCPPRSFATASAPLPPFAR
jgi:hypothetical protein